MNAKSLFVAAGLLMAGQSAHATVLVQYAQINATPTVRLTNSGANFTVSTIGSPLLNITLHDPFTLASMVVQANFNFTGTGVAIASVSGSLVAQTLSTGSFSLTTSAPIAFGAFSGTNILSASFTNGVIVGLLGSRTPQISVNTSSGGFSSVTSDFFADPRIILSDLSITTSGASPLIALIPAGGGNQKLRPFAAASTATFDASVVPEPGTWALMVIGFGLVGFARRRRVAAVAA